MPVYSHANAYSVIFNKRHLTPPQDSCYVTTSVPWLHMVATTPSTSSSVVCLQYKLYVKYQCLRNGLRKHVLYSRMANQPMSHVNRPRLKLWVVFVYIMYVCIYLYN